MDRGGLITLGVTETTFDSDETLGKVTITGLPGDLTNFSGGSYTVSGGRTWTGTAAQFTALTFDAGGTAGTFTLSISAPSTKNGEHRDGDCELHADDQFRRWQRRPLRTSRGIRHGYVEFG